MDTPLAHTGHSAPEVVGLIPAAGKATRLSPLPCSKELYPIGLERSGDTCNVRPKVAAEYLLQGFRLAGISRAYILLRQGKWDIPAYFGDGGLIDMHLAYLAISNSSSVPETLSYAYPFVARSLVALGFPDVIFEPSDAYVRALKTQRATGADVVLGLFPADRPEKLDMVELDDNGQIRRIVIKPRSTELRYAWAMAVWTPAFTEFLQRSVVSPASGVQRDSTASEVYIGHVIQAALQEGMRVEPVVFPDGSHIDIGTPEDLIKALRTHFDLG